MKIRKGYQPLFYQKEINAYLYQKEPKHRIYELKEEKIVEYILPYQKSWGFTITFGHQYPLLIFPHDCKYWYLFKEIEKFDTYTRCKICLSFLEKIITQQMDDLSIYFFCDSTNLLFDQTHTVHFFYMPKWSRLQKKIDHKQAITIVAKFIFRHLHLQDIIVESKEHLYSKEYLRFYKHVKTKNHYASIVDIYNELYLVSTTLAHTENNDFKHSKMIKKIEKIGISIIVAGILIFYSTYGLIVFKNYIERQYHDLYSIGNQTLYEGGDTVD